MKLKDFYSDPSKWTKEACIEEAKKYDDHALDALRYGLMHIFELGANVSLSSVISKGDLKTVEQGGFFKAVGGLFNNSKRF